MAYHFSLFAIILVVGCATNDDTPDLGMAGASVVTIVDVDGGLSPGGDKSLLQAVSTNSDAQFLSELFDYATEYFPERSWNNFGPDSQYRQIVFASLGRKVELKSWHPIYETNANVVAASYGLTGLDGQSRDEFLVKDDQDYVQKRTAFDEIEVRLRKRFGL